MATLGDDREVMEVFLGVDRAGRTVVSHEWFAPTGWEERDRARGVEAMKAISLYARSRVRFADFPGVVAWRLLIGGGRRLVVDMDHAWQMDGYDHQEQMAIAVRMAIEEAVKRVDSKA